MVEPQQVFAAGRMRAWPMISYEVVLLLSSVVVVMMASLSLTKSWRRRTTTRGAFPLVHFHAWGLAALSCMHCGTAETTDRHLTYLKANRS